MASDVSSSDQHDCTDCPLVTDRRTFLHRSVGQLGSALLLLGSSSDIARALSGIAPSVTHPLDDETRSPQSKSKSYAIPEADGVQIDHDNEVILIRWLGSVYAFSLRCPHQNTSLRWLPKEEHFQCPKHRSEYAADGDFISGRATRAMDRYAIKRDGKAVVVDLAKLYDQSADPKGWASAAVAL